MKTITVSDFRKNIRLYAELAEKEQIIVHRRPGKPFAIVPLENIEDNGYSETFVKRILSAYESAKEGNVTEIRDINNIWEDIL